LSETQLTAPSFENPRHWLTDYLHTRTRLASQESDFQCDPACGRPGCKNPDMQIPVSLVDLLGASLRLGEPVSTLYGRHYVLGVFCNDRADWLRLASLELRKPCPFLGQDLCGIYPVRPLPCILFPEYLASRGTFAAHAVRPQFQEYHCFRHALKLSPARDRVVAKLRDMWEREQLISSYYLFNHAACHIDCSHLAQTLDANTEAGPEQGFQTNQKLDTFFQEHVAGAPPFNGITEKIHRLDTQEGQAHFLQLLQDDALVKKLRQAGDDRALVFRFKKGKLKAKRRGIVSTEYKFY
jgi:Fe-S-cluster containining protein